MKRNVTGHNTGASPRPSASREISLDEALQRMSDSERDEWRELTRGCDVYSFIRRRITIVSTWGNVTAYLEGK